MFLKKKCMINKCTVGQWTGSVVLSHAKLKCTHDFHLQNNVANVGYSPVLVRLYPSLVLADPTRLCNIGSGIAHHLGYCASVVTA